MSGAGRTRTWYHRFWRPVLCQLSHCPGRLIVAAMWALRVASATRLTPDPLRQEWLADLGEAPVARHEFFPLEGLQRLLHRRRAGQHEAAPVRRAQWMARLPRERLQERALCRRGATPDQREVR